MNKQIAETLKEIPEVFGEANLDSRCAAIVKVLCDRIKNILSDVKIGAQIDELNVLVAGTGYRTVLMKSGDMDFAVTIIPFKPDSNIGKADIEPLITLRQHKSFQKQGHSHIALHFSNDKAVGGQAVTGTARRHAQENSIELIRWDIFIDRLIKKAPR